jgi:asparagine synthase (glutamine-hydrolysing)
VRRYWSFSFGARTDEQYVPDVAGAYADAVGTVLDATEGTPGLWLSGGLDSRMLAATMRDHRDEFRAYTYNRPLDHDFGPFRSNVDLAGAVTDVLGVPHHVIDITPADLVERIPELVAITDGQVGWNTAVHLSAVADVDPDDAGVMLEGSVPIVCGEHVWRSHLRGSSHPADALYDIHARVDGGLVKDALSAPVEPKDTFIDEARAAPHERRNERILAATNANYYPRKHFTDNKVARARVGTREVLADERLLGLVGDLPAGYRTGSIPLSGGRIPHVPSPMKLRLMRALDGDLLDVPYDETQLPPSYPHALHGVGFVAKNAVQRGLSTSTIGQWYRTDGPLRECVDDLLHSAAGRDRFDAGTLLDVREEHLRGDADHMEFIAPLTTVELFLRNVLDR